MIRNKVNPLTSQIKEVTIKQQSFRNGDKVMYIRNNRDSDIYNGDIGLIKKIKDNIITIDFNNHIVELEKEEWKYLKLAYTLSIHKAQGGQAPVVMTVLSDEHSLMLARNLFYTAMTRAEKTFVLFSTKNAMHQSIITNRVSERKTSLTNQLNEIKKYVTTKQIIG